MSIHTLIDGEAGRIGLRHAAKMPPHRAARFLATPHADHHHFAYISRFIHFIAYSGIPDARRAHLMISRLLAELLESITAAMNILSREKTLRRHVTGSPREQPSRLIVIFHTHCHMSRRAAADISKTATSYRHTSSFLPILLLMRLFDAEAELVLPAGVAILCRRDADDAHRHEMHAESRICFLKHIFEFAIGFGHIFSRCC